MSQDSEKEQNLLLRGVSNLNRLLGTEQNPNILQASYKPPASEQVKQAERGEAWWRDMDWTSAYAANQLPGVGLGFVVYPYMAVWEKIWGAVPTEDYAKYKQLITQDPLINETIWMHTINTVAQGFDLDYPLDIVINDVKQFLERHGFNQLLRIMVREHLIFGNSYVELIRMWICPQSGHDITLLRPSYEIQGETGPFWWTERMDVVFKHNELYPDHVLENPYGELIRFKPLDSEYMRVRRDAYGTVLGFAQWYIFPLVTFLADEVFQLRYQPSAWQYENAYGNSMLRPILFHEEALREYEAIMQQIMRAFVKPFFLVELGNSQVNAVPTLGGVGNEVTQAQYNQFLQDWGRRKAGADVIVRTGGLISKVTPITPGLEALKSTEFWLQWLNDQRQYALNAPKHLVDPKGLNRSTANLLQESYFTFIQAIRQSLADQIQSSLMPVILRSLYGPVADELIHEFGVPKIIWKPIKEESLADKTPIIIDLYRSNIIDVNEARIALGYRPKEQEELETELEVKGIESQGGKVGFVKPPASAGGKDSDMGGGVQESHADDAQKEHGAETLETERTTATLQQEGNRSNEGMKEEIGQKMNSFETISESDLIDIEDWIDDIRERLRVKKIRKQAGLE
jgi:hypothetical protein